MRSLKEDLLSVSEVLRTLASKTEKLVVAIDKLDGRLAGLAETTVIDAGAKAAGNGAGNGTAKTRANSRKRKVSDTDRVVRILKRAKTGVDVTTLKKKTGFNDKKVSNIVHRACKKGSIIRAGRGIYTVPS